MTYPPLLRCSYGCAPTNENYENPGAPIVCSTFRSRFPGGAAQMCNTIFGSAFVYSNDASTCLSPYFYSGVNPNAAATGYGASNTPTPTATPQPDAPAAATLTQSQTLAIGLGVGIGVPVLLVAVGVAAFFYGAASSAKALKRTERSSRALEMASTGEKAVVPWPETRSTANPA